jgi:hypothetical protein
VPVLIGRGDRIRAYDILLPNHAPYRARLYSESAGFSRRNQQNAFMLDAFPPSKDRVLVYVSHLAGEAGFEPTTYRLTAGRSAAELHPKMPNRCLTAPRRDHRSSHHASAIWSACVGANSCHLFTAQPVARLSEQIAVAARYLSGYWSVILLACPVVPISGPELALP